MALISEVSVTMATDSSPDGVTHTDTCPRGGGPTRGRVGHCSLRWKDVKVPVIPSLIWSYPRRGADWATAQHPEPLLASMYKIGPKRKGFLAHYFGK